MIMTSRSARETRTSGMPSAPTTTKEIPHSQSDSAGRQLLKGVHSDDSSLWSGLNGGSTLLNPTRITGSNSEGSDTALSSKQQPRQPLLGRIIQSMPKGILRKPTLGTASKSMSGESSSMQEFEDGTEFFSDEGYENDNHVRDDHHDSQEYHPYHSETSGTLSERSQRSLLRELPAMADSSTAFDPDGPDDDVASKHHSSANCSIHGASVVASSQSYDKKYDVGGGGPVVVTVPSTNSASVTSGLTNEIMANAGIMGVQPLTRNLYLNETIPNDEDNSTTLTWGSVNEMVRPKGVVKMVSQVSFLGREHDQTEPGAQPELDLELPNPPSSETRDDLAAECSLEASSNNDNGDRSIIDVLDDFEKNMDEEVRNFQEESHIRVPGPNISYDQRENFNLDEIGTEPTFSFHSEQQERTPQHLSKQTWTQLDLLREKSDQYRSEIEQMEEQHNSELKLMDDRYKQQLSELKRTYEDEMARLDQEKDAAVIEASRNAGEYVEVCKQQVDSVVQQLEKFKSVAVTTIRTKVEEAAKVITDSKDREITARLGALRKSYEKELEKVRNECDERIEKEKEKMAASVIKRMEIDHNVVVEDLTQQIEELQEEQQSMFNTLDLVRGNFDRHYPEEMILARHFGRFPGAARKLLKNDNGSGRDLVKLLGEVLELFAFILESTENKKIASNTAVYRPDMEKKKAERSHQYAQMKLHFMLRHRAEIEQAQKQKAEAQLKMEEIEEHAIAPSRHYRFLEGKHKKAVETFRQEMAAKQEHSTHTQEEDAKTQEEKEHLVPNQDDSEHSRTIHHSLHARAMSPSIRKARSLRINSKNLVSSRQFQPGYHRLAAEETNKTKENEIIHQDEKSSETKSTAGDGEGTTKSKDPKPTISTSSIFTLGNPNVDTNRKCSAEKNENVVAKPSNHKSLQKTDIPSPRYVDEDKSVDMMPQTDHSLSVGSFDHFEHIAESQDEKISHSLTADDEEYDGILIERPEKSKRKSLGILRNFKARRDKEQNEKDCLGGESVAKNDSSIMTRSTRSLRNIRTLFSPIKNSNRNDDNGVLSRADESVRSRSLSRSRTQIPSEHYVEEARTKDCKEASVPLPAGTPSPFDEETPKMENKKNARGTVTKDTTSIHPPYSASDSQPHPEKREEQNGALGHSLSVDGKSANLANGSDIENTVLPKNSVETSPFSLHKRCSERAANRTLSSMTLANGNTLSKDRSKPERLSIDKNKKVEQESQENVEGMPVTQVLWTNLNKESGSLESANLKKTTKIHEGKGQQALESMDTNKTEEKRPPGSRSRLYRNRLGTYRSTRQYREFIVSPRTSAASANGKAEI